MAMIWQSLHTSKLIMIPCDLMYIQRCTCINMRFYEVHVIQCTCIMVIYSIKLRKWKNNWSHQSTFTMQLFVTFSCLHVDTLYTIKIINSTLNKSWFLSALKTMIWKLTHSYIGNYLKKCRTSQESDKIWVLALVH